MCFLGFLTGYVTLGKPLTLTGPQFPCAQRWEHSLRLVEWVKQSSALCNMLVFSGAALPSLHFHEKDPGSAQFLWSQLCKQIPGSTLIGTPVSPLPPPGIHQDSTVPGLHSPCRLGMPAGGQKLSPTPSRPLLGIYQVPGHGLWTGRWLFI